MSDIRVGGAYVDLYLKGMEKLDKGINDATNMLKSLTKEMEKNEKKRISLENKIKSTTAKYGDNSKKVKELKEQLNSLNGEQKELKDRFKAVSDSLEEQIKLYDNLAEKTKETGKYFNTLSSSITLFKGIVTSIAAKNLYHFLIDMNSEIEQYLTSFSILLGDMEDAERIMEDITDIAKITPFETTDVVKAVEILAQYGESQDTLISQFNKLANLSRGNAANLDAIAQAYSRMKNAGKITLRELNMMIVRSVPIMQALSDVTGKTVAELYKLIRTGKLGIEDLDNAINYLATDGGKFENLIEEQGKTFEGRISTLKDYISFFGKDLGEEAFESLKGYINDIITEMERLEESGELEYFTKKFGSAINVLVEIIANVLGFLYKIKGTLGGSIATFAAFTSAVNLAGTTLEFLGVKSKLASISLSATFLAIELAIASLAKSSMEYLILEEQLSRDSDELLKRNEKITKNYKNQTNSLIKNTEAAHALSKELKSLIDISEKSAYQKNRIAEIVDELNKIYPDLNMQYSAERDEINKNISSLDDYIDKYREFAQQKSNEKLYTDLLKEQEDLRIEREKQTQLLEEEEERYRKLYDEYFGTSLLDGGIFEMGIFKYSQLKDDFWESSNTITILGKNIEELDKQIEQNASAIKKHEENMAEYARTGKEFNEVVLEEKITYAGLGNEIKAANDVITKAFADLNDESSNYMKNVNSTIDAVNDLSDSMAKNASETGFTVDEAMKLISMYPELADAIYSTSEGYKFEESALKELQNQKIQEAENAINAQLIISQETARQIQNRMIEYAKEGNALGMLEYLYSEYFATIMSYQKELKPLTLQLDLAKTIDNRNIKKTKATGETYDEELIRNLKFDYDMGIINAEEYYNELNRIKDKYYDDGTRKWQQYTLEIKKGREKLEEEKRKAAEEEFKGTIEGMRNNIDDRVLYGRIDEEEEIKQLNDIRQYILKSYLDRKIDYENFAEQLREIDRDIYEAEKDMLEDSIDELNKLRDKKYKDAVDKINDYYDAIFAAQKRAEREQEMQELKETAALYEGAVSRAGQQKLKELQKDIQELEREKMQDELENQREYHLENLDAKYQALEENQNLYFETVQSGIKTTAEIVQEYTKQINDFFSQINGILSTSRTQGGSTNNSLTINQTINDAASNRAAIDMTKIISSYGFK